MIKKEVMMLISLILFLPLVLGMHQGFPHAGAGGGGDVVKEFDPDDPSTWTSENFHLLTSEQIAASWPISAEQKGWISDPAQLSAISPNELGDLGGYRTGVVSSVITANYDVVVAGSFSGAAIRDDSLVYPDGSVIDLQQDITTITKDENGIDIETPTTRIEDGTGVTLTATSLSVDSAASITDVAGHNAEATNPTSYTRTASGVTIASASSLTVDGSELHAVADVRVSDTPTGFLLQATSQDDNNPFRFNSGITDITTIISKNEVIQAVYGGDAVSFVLPSGAIIEFEGAEGRTSAQTTISIKQIPVGLEVTAANTKFSYRNALVEESVAAKDQTIFRFDENEGIFFLRLGKESVYTYKDQLRTFYLHNPADQEYTVFVNKPSHQLALEDNTYNAYLDPANDFFQFQGIITYGIEMEPIIQSLQEQNMITINGTILSISSPAPICASPVSITRTSLYEIREECGRQLIKYTAAPNAITEYHALNHPTITIEEDILTQSQWYGLFQMRPDDAFCESQFQQYLERVCSA